jgi:hypothetical protein
MVASRGVKNRTGPVLLGRNISNRPDARQSTCLHFLKKRANGVYLAFLPHIDYLDSGQRAGRLA